MPVFRNTFIETHSSYSDYSLMKVLQLLRLCTDGWDVDDESRGMRRDGCGLFRNSETRN
jgi:hypothetical protein